MCAPHIKLNFSKYIKETLHISVLLLRITKYYRARLYFVLPEMRQM